MRNSTAWLDVRRLTWRQSFSWLFLGWLVLDLFVVHLLCPEYAAGELFGCAVPAVVAVPSEAPPNASPAIVAPVELDGLADQSTIAHSCLWNTSALLKPVPFALPPYQLYLPSVIRVRELFLPYTRLLIGAVFHPPRLA